VYFQTLVHSQSISQCRGSRISNFIPFKTVEESTPKLVQAVLLTIVHYLKVTFNYPNLIYLQSNSLQHWGREYSRIINSVMIIITGASLSEQHTDLLICHCTKQDLLRTSGYLGITYDKPTASIATVSLSTYAQPKLYTKVISCISDIISAVYADGPYLKQPQPLS